MEYELLPDLICSFLNGKSCWVAFMYIWSFFSVWKNVYFDPCLYFGMSCLFIIPLQCSLHALFCFLIHVHVCVCVRSEEGSGFLEITFRSSKRAITAGPFL